MGSSDFEWNKRPEGEPDVHQIAEQKALEAGEEGKLSHFLVDVHSALDQLHHTYLSSEQRADLAQDLKEGFFCLQRIANTERDTEMRHRLIHYLVIIGSIGVKQRVDHEEGGKLFTFLEALSQGSLFQWCNRFYSATHGIEQRNQEEKVVAYVVDEQGFEAERAARRKLMLWIGKD